MATLLGMGMICVVSVIVLFLYRSRYDRIIGEYDDFILLLNFIKDKISNSSMKMNDILAQEIDLVYLNKLDFLANARRINVYSAYKQIEEKILIYDTDKKLLGDYFLNMGTDLLQIEMNRLSTVIKKLSDNRDVILSQCPEKKKVGSTLIVCSALLIIIFLV